VRNLLVACYFCPAVRRRAGGVQQVVGPLVDGLRESGEWNVVVVHPDHCQEKGHEALPEVGEPGCPDHVDPDRLLEQVRRFRVLATQADVVLGVDRILPMSGATPRVLMSNTLAYLTEASAVVAGGWSHIVVPTHHFAQRVRTIDPRANVCIVPYGLHPSVIARAASLPSPRWEDPVLVVRLPHRPDPRKGHARAIEGLARSLPTSSRVRLEIAWIDEPRYSSFRRELEGLAMALGVDAHVCIRPWLEGDERWDAVKSTHAVLQLGSFEETFGLSVVETVLSGRLAITAVQPAVREVVGTSPLLVEVGDPLAWYQALERAIRVLSVSPVDAPAAGLAPFLSLDRMVARYGSLLRAASEADGHRR
jgi:glycosyltransferase involved in cell wall biosynthesis